jgi:hypothetical protein
VGRFLDPPLAQFDWRSPLFISPIHLAQLAAGSGAAAWPRPLVTARAADPTPRAAPIPEWREIMINACVGESQHLLLSSRGVC